MCRVTFGLWGSVHLMYPVGVGRITSRVHFGAVSGSGCRCQRFLPQRQVRHTQLCNVHKKEALLKRNTRADPLKRSTPVLGDSKLFLLFWILFYQILPEDETSFGWSLGTLSVPVVYGSVTWFKCDLWGGRRGWGAREARTMLAGLCLKRSVLQNYF